ncbi:hypothetical protein QIW31_01875 [Francisellaceae bacterium CB299]|jgi:hypothetical protein
MNFKMNRIADISLEKRVILSLICIFTLSLVTTILIKWMGLNFTRQNIGYLITSISIVYGFNLSAIINIKKHDSRPLYLFIGVSNLITFATFVTYIFFILCSDQAFNVSMSNQYVQFFLCYLTIMTISFLPFTMTVIKDY